MEEGLRTIAPQGAALSGGATVTDGMSKAEKAGVAILAITFAGLFVLWFSNYWLEAPILGIGEVENWGWHYRPVAAEAPMTWRITQGFIPMAVKKRIDPPAIPSAIRRIKAIESSPRATLYLAEYLSDSQVVYGVLGVPSGQGPWPGAVVCHPSDDNYTSGFHTQDTIKFLAEMGVYAFSTDYRGWGKSEGGRGNEVRDVWNATASMRADPSVKPEKIALVGYSMGGGIAARAAAADTGVSLLVLYYAQMFGSIDELRAALSYGEIGPGQNGIRQLVSTARSAQCDQREMEYVIRMISPIYHLNRFKGAVAIFHGRQDNVVSMRQSEALYGELRKQGNDVSIKDYPLSHAFANSIENPSKKDLEAVIQKHLLGG